MSRLVIGADDFKALSSESRVKIIKLLGERNHTMTELAKKMEMSAPSVKQHLDLLEQSGLVSVQDDGHKWKYYTLTKKSKKLLDAEEPNFVVVLASGVLGLLGIGALLFGALRGSLGTFYASPAPNLLSEASRAAAPEAADALSTTVAAGTGGAQAPMAQAVPQSASAAANAASAAAGPDLVLVAIGVVLLVLALVVSRNARH